MPIIFNNKKSEYVIAIPQGDALVEKTAARELCLHFEKVFGEILPIVNEDEVSGKAFYIGHTNYAKERGICGTSNENWIIKVSDGNIILTGGTKPGERGIIYSVYHFLEDIVDIRWWSPYDEYIPNSCDLSLEDDFESSGTPAISYRKSNAFLWHKGNHAYHVRVRESGITDEVNEEGFLDSLKEYGGGVYIGRPDDVHTLPKYFPKDEYFPDHPDWFAWSKVLGKRVGDGDYCLTNESFFEAMLKKLLKNIKDEKELALKKGVESPKIYVIAPPDLADYHCECEKCCELREKSGRMGYILHFINKLAREVAKLYPDVNILTFAYADYMYPPSDGMLPEKNVIIQVAAVESDLMRGLNDRTNKKFLHVLKAWHEIQKKSGCGIFIWDYLFNLFFETLTPIANKLSDAIKTFHENGVSGIMVENRRYSTFMWELNQHLFMRLCENPYEDADALIRDFMQKFYGVASEYVYKFYCELVRSANDNDFGVACAIASSDFNYLDLDAYLNSYDILEDAMKAAEGDVALEEKIEWLQYHLYSSLLLKYSALKRRAPAENKRFDFDIEELKRKIRTAAKHFASNPRYQECDQTSVLVEAEYLANRDLDDEFVPLPDELSGICEEDVFQFYLKDSSYLFHFKDCHSGYVVDDPLSPVKKTIRTYIDDILWVDRRSNFEATSKTASEKHALQLFIQQDNEYIDGIKLYKEDIKQGGYHLYKIGSVSDIKSHGETRLDLFNAVYHEFSKDGEITSTSFGNAYNWINLAGISVLFPMDACDVYASMRFEGEKFGGKADDRPAVYMDRIIIVKK